MLADGEPCCTPPIDKIQIYSSQIYVLESHMSTLFLNKVQIVPFDDFINFDGVVVGFLKCVKAILIRTELYNIFWV